MPAAARRKRAMEEACGLARRSISTSSPANWRPSEAEDADRQRRGRTAAPAGRGEEIALVVFDGALSPIQQRNLETAWKCKVIDRTGLILEIFGEAPAPGRASCRSSWWRSAISAAAWSGPGPI